MRLNNHNFLKLLRTAKVLGFEQGKHHLTLQVRLVVDGANSGRLIAVKDNHRQAINRTDDHQPATREFAQRAPNAPELTKNERINPHHAELRRVQSLADVIRRTLRKRRCKDDLAVLALTHNFVPNRQLIIRERTRRLQNRQRSLDHIRLRRHTDQLDEKTCQRQPQYNLATALI